MLYLNFFSPVSAPWLSLTLSWFQMWMNDETDELEREIKESMHRIQGLYVAAQAGLQNEKVL